MVDRLPRGAGLGSDIVGALDAPEIFFELVPNQGASIGTLSFTLATTKWALLADGQIRKEFIAVCHLRCSALAAQALRAAIDNALLLATPPQSSDAKPESAN